MKFSFIFGVFSLVFILAACQSKLAPSKVNSPVQDTGADGSGGGSGLDTDPARKQLPPPRPVYKVNPNSLRAQAEQLHLLIGTTGPANEALAVDFNAVTLDDEIKFKTIQPKAGEFHFEAADAQAQFAFDHGMQVLALSLVSSEALPEWISAGAPSQKDLETILHDYIKKVVGHFHEKFPSVVFVWNVVDSAIDPNGLGIRKSPWSQMNDQPDGYISLAYEWAHEADATAKLFYRDVGANGMDDQANAVFALISKLRQAGVPVAGVDLSGAAKAEDVQAIGVRYQKLGVAVRITTGDDATASAGFAECFLLSNCTGVTPKKLSGADAIQSLTEQLKARIKALSSAQS